MNINRIRKAAYQWVSQRPANELYLLFSKPIRQRNLRRFLDEGIISESGMETALAKSAGLQARLDLRHVLAHQIRPDHLSYPEFLAYGIENGILPSRDINRIRFDHGDTASSFAKYYSKPNLPRHMLNYILIDRAHIPEDSHYCSCSV
ncbi:MAG: hypothetical protein ACMXYF_03665 [Candidatus Woesearchaeota archaeon]